MQINCPFQQVIFLNLQRQSLYRVDPMVFSCTLIFHVDSMKKAVKYFFKKLQAHRENQDTCIVKMNTVLYFLVALQ